MRNLTLTILICFSWLLCSCEYEFSERNFIEIKDSLNASPVINVTELTPGDTINIFNEVYVNYNITLPGTELYKVEISLNDQILYEFNTLQGTFLINPHYIPNGLSALNLKVLSNKKNGSLADIYQKDTIYYSNTWIVNLDAAMPLKNNIVDVNCYNGTLKIKWEKYQNSNFSAYYLIRNYKNYDDNSDVWPEEEDEIIAVIHNRDSVEYTDSNFVGGRACYYLIVENQTKSGPYSYSPYYRTKSDGYVFSDVLPVLSYESMDDGKLILKWTKSRYYGNVNQYIVHSHLYGSVPQIDMQFSPTDTFAGASYGVPYENRFGLSVKSGNKDKFCSLLVFDPIVNQMPYRFEWISYDYFNEFYYLRKDLQSLHIIESENFSLIKSKESGMAFGNPTYLSSMNGIYLAGINGSGISVYNNNDITGSSTYINLSPGSFLPGSATNQGYVNFYSDPVFTGNENRYHGIADLNSDNIIVQRNTYGVTNADLSVNSKYYAVTTAENLKIYSFDTSDITELLSVNAAYTWIKFSKQDENLLFTVNSNGQKNKIEIRSANQSFGIINEYSVKATQEFCYDPVTETICGSDENYMMYIYNATTGEEILKLQSYYGEYFPAYFNGTLFFRSFQDWDNAYFYKIPELHEN
jgi:hypothetical protein